MRKLSVAEFIKSSVLRLNSQIHDHDEYRTIKNEKFKQIKIAEKLDNIWKQLLFQEFKIKNLEIENALLTNKLNDQQTYNLETERKFKEMVSIVRDFMIEQKIKEKKQLINNEKLKSYSNKEIEFIYAILASMEKELGKMRV